MSRPLLRLLLVIVLAAGAVQPSSAAGGSPPLDDAARLVGPGAVIGPPDGLCAGRFQFEVPGVGLVCTHGPDPDTMTMSTRPRPTGNLLPDQPMATPPGPAAGPPQLRCYGDGQSGPRVQVIYARPADRPDRFGTLESSLRRWTSEADAVFAASAASYGAVRHLRFVTDANCDLLIDTVELSPLADDTFQTTVLELTARGYNRRDRKYLVYMDADVVCGLGAHYGDHQPGQENRNNGGAPQVARVDTTCWGLGSRGNSVEAHELLHTLGGVNASAPNATTNGHCVDESDLMCYKDNDLTQLQQICPGQVEALLDCNGDDYFRLSPQPGTYLATHWNTIDSVFLAHDEGIPAISVGDTTVLEGDEGATPATFTVTLSGPSADPVSIRWSTDPGASGEDSDFRSASGAITMPPGATQASFTVDVVGDSTDEGDEQVPVQISDAAGGVLRDRQGVATILDDDPKRLGYYLVAKDGGVFAFGDAGFFGSLTDGVRDDIITLAPRPAGGGYWMLARDGTVIPFGDAPNLGSFASEFPPTAIVASPSGGGYAVVNGQGQMRTFGDAADVGIGVGNRAGQYVVGLARTYTGKGYWLLGQHGKVDAVGDALDLGSVTGLGDGLRATAIAATPTGQGYWVLITDGRVISFGDAPPLGPAPAPYRGTWATGIAANRTGRGVWTTEHLGTVHALGDAPVLGSPPRALRDHVLGMAALP